jgi:iron complex outermembrane receptor protein
MHHPIYRSFVAALWRHFDCLRLSALFAVAVFAANASTAAEESATGIVAGRVLNATNGTYLNNARVSVEKTSIEAFTNDAGEFQLRNVPAGEANLRIEYAGQQPIVEAVSVEAGKAITKNFTFNAAGNIDQKTGVLTLDPFAVEAARFKNAQEIATNEERTSINIKNVVALDSLGYHADGNIGDFVRYLPGIDVTNGSTDGNTNNPDSAMTAAVRGFGAESTAILIDGMPVASGSVTGNGALTRTVMLDGISINNASRLEVIKVATPDMSQDSPGGAINLITRGAFELSRVTYDLSVAFNGNTNTPSPFKRTPGPYENSFKTLPSVRFSASIPLSSKLGVSISAASDNKYSLTRNSNMRDWFYAGRTVTINGVVTPIANAKGGIRIDNPVIDRIDLVDNQWVDHRLSGSVRFDWRPIQSLEIRASGQISTFENTGVFRRTQWRYTNGAGILDWGDTYVTGRQRTATFNPGYSVGMTTDSRDKAGFTSSGYITAKFRKGPWSIDAKASASESYSDLPDLKNGHFSTIDASLSAGRIDLVGIDKGEIGQINVWDANGNPVNYGAFTAWSPSLTPRSSQVNARDTYKQYNFDLTRELDFLPFPASVKIGGQQKTKTTRKSGKGTGYRLQYIGPAASQPTAAFLESEFATEAKYGYATPQHWVDTSKYYDFYKEHPEWFTDTFVNPADNTNLPANNYQSRINTAKGLTVTDTDWYGMLTAKFFRNRMTVVTGSRQTHKHTHGHNLFVDPKFAFVKNPDGTIYRDSFYPNGVRFDGANNAGGRPRDAVLTDTALRTRMQAAGVVYLPDKLELAPNGTSNGTGANNLFLGRLNRYTRQIDSKKLQPHTPQVQVAYEISKSLRVQAAWSRETRLPDHETGNGVLGGTSSFTLNEADLPTSDPGGEGSIVISNVKNIPEINTSYNVKLAYYPRNGSGRYSFSYYYKVVDNSWETIDTYNTDPGYDSLIDSIGFDPEEFRNYRVSTTTATGLKTVRKGFEIEAAQNLGALAQWARGVDVFVTYSRRPVTPSTGGESRLGWIPQLPVRAKWTGGVSYSMRRFSAQARFTYLESGITYGGSGNVQTVTLPDGTSRSVQFYDLNQFRPELNLQANYVYNKHFSFFATANRVLEPAIHRRISDAQTGYQPDYASYRSVQDRGIAVSAGVKATF